MAFQPEREQIPVEQAVADMLVALHRAHYDHVRPHIPERGIEERDLAFEAGLLAPPEMEIKVYGTQKRSRVLQIIRELDQRGWAKMEMVQGSGAYHVFLLPEGERQAEWLARPWWRRLADKVKPQRNETSSEGDQG